jgi:hypothetical protein
MVLRLILEMARTNVGWSLAFETWVPPRKWVLAGTPRSPKEEVCFAWEIEG